MFTIEHLAQKHFHSFLEKKTVRTFLAEFIDRSDQNISYVDFYVERKSES